MALNIFRLEGALELPVTFLLHPVNLFITKDAQAKIAYRGIPGLMVPQSLSSEDFLRQAKCFTVTLFSDFDFMDLYNGSLELETLPDFLNDLCQAEDIATAVTILERYYVEKSAKEQADLVLVPSRRHRVFKLATISSEQKKVILNNVTLKSDELYLTYWIQVGRNRFEEALDIAKRINDSDLILYALTQEIKQVREDGKLSGKDRESKLNTLESEYKKYWDSRSQLLTSDSSSNASTSSSPSSQEKPSESKPSSEKKTSPSSSSSN